MNYERVAYLEIYKERVWQHTKMLWQLPFLSTIPTNLWPYLTKGALHAKQEMLALLKVSPFQDSKENLPTNVHAHCYCGLKLYTVKSSIEYEYYCSVLGKCPFWTSTYNIAGNLVSTKFGKTVLICYWWDLNLAFWMISVIGVHAFNLNWWY